MAADSPPTDTSTLLEFLYRLGQAYLACGEQTALVELYLRRTASARGVRRSRVVAFPTAIFLSLGTVRFRSVVQPPPDADAQAP